MRTTLAILMAFVANDRFTMATDDFPEPVNTQAAGQHPPSPGEMLDLFELPPGFHVTLFAGEPDVRQPIAFDFDDRGRIWVAENYSYGAHGTYDPALRDRIIMLHDDDGDGEHDERKVFWDKGWMLTGLTWGYGGLWILNDGALSFIADRNGDDIPDSEPVEMLNGWTKTAGHNFVSGLLWGPDGWLYGRHGITDTSYPGTPDTPQAERQPMNCGIWRFHPRKNLFEVVCHGTTNPWGLDYDPFGQMFMSNNVIGHLWHVIPGAHYERMFGQDFNPHLYELMGQTADHYHWDQTGKWSESRDGKADDLGGGHSHCGLMIYQGQNFPEQYRGKAFMCNTHGRCVNVDRLEQNGASFVAKHESNFLKVNSPWFRGVELKYGPRGCVYLSDWSDNGECHDHDGVHRTSGRIYRISYGDPNEDDRDTPDLSGQNLTTLALKAISSTEISEWELRHARRLLQEQFPDAPKNQKAEILSLRDNYWTNHESVRLVGPQTFSLLLSLDVFEPHHLRTAIISPNEHIRRQVIEYLASNAALLRDVHDILDSWLFNHEDSPAVLLAYAGAIQRFHDQPHASPVPEFPVSDFPSISGLMKLCRVCSEDDSLRLMTWYALERYSANSGQPTLPLEFIQDPKVRGFLARWLASDWDRHRDLLLQSIKSWPRTATDFNDPQVGITEPVEATQLLLQGILDGLEGQIIPEQPVDWNTIQNSYATFENAEIDQLVSELSAVFGDRAALDRLRNILNDRDGHPGSRSKAVHSLAAQKDDESIPMMLSLLNDRDVYVDVAAALASFDDPRIPEELLKRWDSLRHGSREAATDTLCSRRSYALALAAALDEGHVDSQQLTASHIRQLMAFNDPRITEIVQAKWGVINESSEAKEHAISRWKQTLTTDVLKAADLKNGEVLFKRNCANCHRLYGDGKNIGPDLTGSNRGNMDYVLGNVIDPSAEVPRQFTTSVIALNSGRIITGVIVAKNANTISVQTDKELMVIAVSNIEERTRTGKSLMPDGLLDPLSEEQVRDLIGYVMQRR